MKERKKERGRKIRKGISDMISKREQTRNKQKNIQVVIVNLIHKQGYKPLVYKPKHDDKANRANTG